MDASGGAIGTGRIDRPPALAARASLSADFGRRFLVFIDTEEEFDWNAPLTRDRHGTSHVRAIPRMQVLLEAHGIVPTYLVDYPIVACDAAVEILGGVQARGACAIGSQLHPWVNPPFDEALTGPNSFAGNLPAALERAKIVALTECIVARFGRRPTIYRGGRYGVGPNSADILESLGYALDVSVRARFDYSAEGGPDFTDIGVEPFWGGSRDGLLELPFSTAFTGGLRRHGAALWRSSGRVPLLRGALARSRLLSRVSLTPEGVTAQEAIAAIDALLEEGQTLFSLSFHSPSLEPGHSPYVRDAADLKRFYRWWDVVLSAFAARAIAPAGAEELLNAAGRARGGKSAANGR